MRDIELMIELAQSELAILLPAGQMLNVLRHGGAVVVLRVQRCTVILTKDNGAAHVLVSVVLNQPDQRWHHCLAIARLTSTAWSMRSTTQYSSVWCASVGSPGPSMIVGGPP